MEIVQFLRTDVRWRSIYLVAQNHSFCFPSREQKHRHKHPPREACSYLDTVSITNINILHQVPKYDDNDFEWVCKPVTCFDLWVDACGVCDCALLMCIKRQNKKSRSSPQARQISQIQQQVSPLRRVWRRMRHPTDPRCYLTCTETFLPGIKLRTCSHCGIKDTCNADVVWQV